MFRRLSLLLAVIVLASPVHVWAGQGSSDKGASPTAAPPTKAPAPHRPVENWGVLKDVKTGLNPMPPFEIQRDEQPDFVRSLVRLQWRVGDPIDLWIMRPKSTEKVPVVLYLYSYPSETDQFRDDAWCKRATAGGFAAVGFVSALTGQRFINRPMKEWFVSELQESLGSSVHDVQLILNYLSTQSDLDVTRVGMFGMGSGGTIALLAAQADPRISTINVLDPWGDWPRWLRESPVVPEAQRPKYTTDEFFQSLATLDPIAYLPALGSRSLRIQQTMTDQVTPKDVKEKFAAAVSDPTQSVKYADARGLLAAWQNFGLAGWIKQHLRPSTTTERVAENKPVLANAQ
jgi:pimeloyl-ACP methyl ester carboxylesterase